MENQNITLELSVNEVNLLLAGLSELPFKQVADLFNKIHVQAAAALQPKPVEVVDNDSTPDITPSKRK